MSKKRQKETGEAEEAVEVEEEIAEVEPGVEEAKEEIAEVPEPKPVAIEEPSLVQLGSLTAAALFELNGVRYRVAEKTPECVVCHSLRYFDEGPLLTDKGWTIDKTVSLGVSTMVTPVK